VLAEPEQRWHRVRVRYVVEQNVEVEAGRRPPSRGCIAVFRRFSPS